MNQSRFEKKPIGNIYTDMQHMTRKKVREIGQKLEFRHVLFSLLAKMESIGDCHILMTDHIVKKYMISSFEGTYHFDNEYIKYEFDTMFDNWKDIDGTEFLPENCNYEISDDTMFRMNVEEEMWLWVQDNYKSKGDKLFKKFTKDDFYLKFEEEVLSWFVISMIFIPVSHFKKVIRTFVDLMKDLWSVILQNDSEDEDDEGD